MIRKLSKCFILVVIGLMVCVPTIVFAESDIVNFMILTDNQEYLVGSNSALSYVIDAENSIDKVSVDGADIDISN